MEKDVSSTGFVAGELPIFLFWVSSPFRLARSADRVCSSQEGSSLTLSLWYEEAADDHLHQFSTLNHDFYLMPSIWYETIQYIRY